LRMNSQFEPQVAVPRRAVRQFVGGETHHEFKRMRPCFYSPIQCLMKRSASLEADAPSEATTESSVNRSD
jgi:hypothetical protein